LTPSSQWGTTPRASIEAECARRGQEAVVAGCEELVRGGRVDDALLLALAGPAATPFLAGAARDDDYWLRVWGLRGLLHVWDDGAADVVRIALGDAHWRVREMALKVTAKHTVDDALDEVVLLRTDGNARVRSAAERAVVALATRRR